MTKEDSNTDAIEIFTAKTGSDITVRLSGDSVWLSHSQLSELLDTSTDNVSLHLKNIFAEGELDENSTTEDSSVFRQEIVPFPNSLPQIEKNKKLNIQVIT